MKLYLALALPLLAFASAVAQGNAGGTFTLNGHVVRSSGEPAAYSTVELVGTRFRQFADADGSFAFSGLARGTYHLRIRQLGFAPVDTMIEVPAPAAMVLQLRAIAVHLENVRVTANGACRRSRVDSLLDPALLMILTAVKDNVAREVLLRSEYRFQYAREESSFQTDPRGRRHAPTVDTLRFVSDAIDPYTPGRFVYSDTTPRGEINTRMRLPSSLDLADPRFLASHCFAFTGMVHGAYKVAFQPLESIFTPDVEGTVSIDTGSFVLRDVTFKLTKPFKVDETLQGVEAFSTFRQILPNVVVVADVELKQFNSVLDKTTLTTSRQKLVSLIFLGRRPDGLPVENVFH